MIIQNYSLSMINVIILRQTKIARYLEKIDRVPLIHEFADKRQGYKWKHRYDRFDKARTFYLTAKIAEYRETLSANSLSNIPQIRRPLYWFFAPYGAYVDLNERSFYSNAGVSSIPVQTMPLISRENFNKYQCFRIAVK